MSRSGEIMRGGYLDSVGRGDSASAVAVPLSETGSNMSMSASSSSSEQRDVDISRTRVIRPILYGRYLAVALILLLTAFIVKSFAEGQVDWSVTWQYMFWPNIMMGLVNTIWLSILCMAIGIVIGLACAVARDSANPVLRGTSIFYTWFFRGAPLILQLLLWFNLALIFPRISLFGLYEARTVEIITPAVAAILGFGLNAGAYTSEIIRAGLLGVDRGQFEAAKAIGMTNSIALRRIVIPQAMRTVLPPLGNEFISLIKMTSLASIIGFSDLLRSVQTIYFINTRIIELLMVATVWYLLVVTILSIFQQMLERRFGRGFARSRQR